MLGRTPNSAATDTATSITGAAIISGTTVGTIAAIAMITAIIVILADTTRRIVMAVTVFISARIDSVIETAGREIAPKRQRKKDN